MENTREITFTCGDVLSRSLIASGNRQYGADAIGDFGEVMREFGIRVSCHPNYAGKGMRVTVEYPDKRDAHEYTHRGSSRELPVPDGSPLRGMEPAEQLAWLDSHTTEEGMAALGLCRSAYFKRKRRMRESLQ